MKRHLQKHIRLILAEAIPACRARGVLIELVTGGRHPKLVLARDGRRRTKQLCSTPSCVDAAVNLAVRDIKRILAEMTGGGQMREAGRGR